MAGTVIQVEGLDNFLRTLRGAAHEVDELDDADQEVADLIAREGRARAPRRTGRLAGSVRGTVTAGRATATTNLIYGPPVHWGWRAHSIEPNRFLLEAAEDTEREWTAVYDKHIQRSLDKVRGV